MPRPIAVLTSTTDKLQAYGSGAAATTNPTVTVLYHDIPQQVKTDFSEYRYGRQYTVLDGATETDILDAPTQGVIRVVDRVVAYNADTANFTIFIAIDDNTTNRIQVRKTLATLESLIGDEDGWDAVTGVFATGVTSGQVLYSSSGVATGSSGLTYSGTVLTVASLVATTADINGGTIDGVTIGGASAGAGTFSAVTDSGLTSGRVTYATTAGLLTDAANLTFNGTTLTANTLTVSTGALTASGTSTLTGNVGIGIASGATPLLISGANVASRGQLSISSTGSDNPRISFYTTSTFRLGFTVSATDVQWDAQNNQTYSFLGTGAATFGGTLTVSGAFGCNTKAAQTAYASGGALNAYGAGANGLDSGANMSALHALVVNMRAALVANGIMS